MKKQKKTKKKRLANKQDKIMHKEIRNANSTKKTQEEEGEEEEEEEIEEEEKDI